MDLGYRSLEALAAALALPKAWLKHEADAGRIPYLMVGPRRRFDLRAVRDSLAGRAAVEVEDSGRADDRQAPKRETCSREHEPQDTPKED